MFSTSIIVFAYEGSNSVKPTYANIKTVETKIKTTYTAVCTTLSTKQ